MAFFQQLRLLLWKNGLQVIRQPAWSLTLIIWPLVIFIIIAVTRNQFPPVVKETCYVAPRNLPSTGFFPFLQTLMCNADSNCHNQSRLLDPTASKAAQKSSGVSRSALMPNGSPLANIAEGRDFFNFSFPQDSADDPAALIEILSSFWVLTQLMLTKPDEMVTLAGVAVTLFEQLQNQTTVWESLLILPQLFSNGSIDQALSSTEALLTNIQGAMRVIESNFPEAGAVLSTVHPLLVGGINLIHYVQNWPGKDVSISLEEVVMLQNDSLSEILKPVLQQVQIPLDKAIGLTLDKNMVRSYLCDNSNNSVLLITACSTGTVDMLLGWISPDKVAKQALLAWSKQVAPHDVAFAKGLLQSLIGGLSPGGSNITRSHRSVDTQPQNIEEELFLTVGQVVMEIVKFVPEVDMVFQSFLRAGFQSMMMSTLVIDTAEDIMTDVLQDANQFKLTYLTLLTNQSQASAWLGRVLNSIMEMVHKSLASGPVTCEELLGPFEWLLNTESVELDVWRSAICQNSSALQEALLMDWLPLIQKAQDLYNAITGQANYSVTLPMILSEWHKVNTSSMQFAMVLGRLSTELGGAYWTNWMPDISTSNVTETLQQSVFFFMVNLGESIQKTELWPMLKNYFHMAYWILNYRPGVTTQPANCSLHITPLAINCDTGFDWPQFVQAVTQALVSPSTDFLVNGLKGTLNLLQHVYGDFYTQQAASFFKNEIKGGDALSDYLINLMQNLDIFLRNVSTLPDSSISNPEIILPHLSNLLQSTGLGPLLPLFLNGNQFNVSAVLDIASKLGRLNQHIFTFNETDPTLPELERLIMLFLSLEGNLTIAVPHIMGHHLLTYSDYFHPDEVARLREAIQPFLNQTSSGFVEAILSAIELLKRVTDSPNGDPTNIILGYLRQLQELVRSLYRLRKIEQIKLSSGELNAEEVTELHMLASDFINLLTEESLQNLTQAGPDAAQNIVIQKFVAFLPPRIQQEAVRFLQDFKALQDKVTQCAGQNCLAGISEIFTFVDQILNMTLSANGTVFIRVAATNLVLEGREYEELASFSFPLLLAPNDAAMVETFKNILHLIRSLMTTPNISVSDVQNALRQSNLTLEELNEFAALAGAVNIKNLMVNVMEIINTRQCFEPHTDPQVTVDCVMGLVSGVSGFLTHLPNLQNETTILSLIPLIINKTVTDIMQTNLSSNPHVVLVHTLNSTLTNIKMGLGQNQLITPEIMKEIKVVEGLIQLIANTEPFDNINATLMMDSTYAQKVYLEIVQWYLKRLENISSNSSASELLLPFFSLTQMQVALQLAQTNFSLFVSNQVEVLIHSLQFPIDGEGVSKIGQTVVEILQRLFGLIKANLEAQVQIPGSETMFNTTHLNVLESQIRLYLNLIQTWMKQPSVPLALTSMLQWGNPSINMSTPVTDIQHLLQTMVHFLSEDQLVYLSLIGNITQSLSNALMVAEQPGGLQSDHFIAAIVEAVQSAMQILTTATEPVPLSLQNTILEILRDSLKLIVHPDMSFASARNISLLILERAESVIQQTVPEPVRAYLLSGLKVATTYFQSVSTPGGPDSWNQMILNEMKTVQSLLPPNSTAQFYISVFINITHFILESGQGKSASQCHCNMSLWACFENASVENMPMIIGKMGQLVNMVLPLVTGIPGLNHTITSSVETFTHLFTFLQQVMTGQPDQNMWDKLEKMVEALLSTFEGTELWHNVSSVLPLIEKSTEIIVNNTQAQNVLILSLQKPLVNLMREMALSVNTSHFNMSEASEKMQSAIEGTVLAAQQANATLQCSDVLKLWQPVGETAGLSPATMAMWCNINLQPVLEAYAQSNILYSNLAIHMGERPMTASATAARIVKNIQSLFQSNVNSARVTEQLIMTISSQFSMLTGQPLSPETQLYWQNQILDMQLQNSLSAVKMLSEELLKVAPWLQLYIKAMEKALHHMLSNVHLLQNSSSSQDLLREVVMIYLTSANITSEDIFSMIMGNFTGLDEASLSGLMREAVRLITELRLFGDDPGLYHAMENFLESNGSRLIVQKVAEMSAWLTSTQETGLGLMTQLLPRMYDIIRSFLAALNEMSMDMPANTQLFETLVGNILAMLRQVVSTGGLLPPMGQHPVMFTPQMMGSNHGMRTRHRREAPMMPPREPMDDFIDLFYINYPAMFEAISAPPTSEEIMETAHMFFTNPDLTVVLNGVTSGLPWGFNASREETLNAALGVLSFVTLPSVFQMSSMDLLMNAVDMLPGGFPFSAVLKTITRVLANESQENLILMQQTFHTVTGLFQIAVTDPRFMEQLDHLRSQVCTLENTQSMQLLMQYLSIEPGQLCHTLLPGLQMLVEGLMVNRTALTDAFFQTFIGDPSTYNVEATWTSVISQGMGFNISSLRSLNINVTSPGVVMVGDLLRNKTAFALDVQQHMDFDPAALNLLMGTTVPNKNLEILSWLLNLRHCNSVATMDMTERDEVLLRAFCSMSPEQWYIFSLLIARHVDMEKLIYRMVLSEEMQGVVGAMLQMIEVITGAMDKIIPVIGQLQGFLFSIEDLNLVANNEFSQMTRGQRTTISTQATFVTISRALCSNGIMALFGISKLPAASESNPSTPNNEQREQMIERFKIPRDASPFCMNMYLDMVNTTGGAIAWAFLKPMLMGQILYTPDTPTTRAIMEKANTTLQEFANLRKYSKDWIDSSNYLLKSAEMLSQTLPMLQNSLGNSFVKNFIEMQTDIDVGRMKETLSNFSNMTVMLENNKHLMRQITTLSTLMVDLSSCIKFDRYRVIFKLPKDEDSSRTRKARSASNSSTSSTSSLPPKVSYTIRMHMDNVMRTDRVRNPYFVKDTHILARQTMRYNRGFIYLQENIDRAIIETQAGQRVTEPAVQLQPFPYPCHLRDEYLEAISFVFPLMLMIAWVLFVADFVKKLVHERELRLHEYMKMMGVNPLSHFFAWFLECAAYLVLTIIILTLVLKHGKILPNSDGFLLFLYLCDYGLSILAFSFLISSFFDKTYIAGLSGSLLYILSFFPFIVVMAVETNLTFSQKSILSVFSPTCFSYASQYVSRYETQGEGIQWSNAYTSPIAGDTASFGWLCWLMLIDSILYFIIGAYIRMVFPGKYGIPAPWYFPFKSSFWAKLCCCIKSKSNAGRGLFFTNVMQGNQAVFNDNKGKGKSTLSSQSGEDFSHLPVGVALHGLSKIYGDRVAIDSLNVSFHEGHVTSLLGHNGAGKTTTMSLLTGLFAPSSGTIEVYGRDMQTNIDDVRKELGVCMQYDVLFDHMTTKEHLLLYGQLKAPQWSRRELHEQVRTILEETGMYAHRHKRVGTLSGGMRRKLSISIAFIGGSRLVVLDEPTTGVDPCSRRSIWDIVIQHKKQRTIIMSTHHLDEAEVLSDRIAFLERGGLKCCGSPVYLKDKLGQGYKLTLTKKMQSRESKQTDDADLKAFIQAHVPEARLKETQGGDLVYSLPPFTSSSAASYRSLLTALDSNLDDLRLGGYGISDTTLEEVFLQLTHGTSDNENSPLSISETLSDTASIDSFPSDTSEKLGDRIKLTGSSMVRGMALAWQQVVAILIKRFHHSRRDWKGLISQILLPVLFVVFAMGLGSIRNDLWHYPELELSPALYKIGPSYSFFSNHNPNTKPLVDTMMSFPGIDNSCLNKSDNSDCTRSTNNWSSRGNRSKPFSICKCTSQEQICDGDNFQPPHKRISSSQIVYNLSGINVENYLVATANDFIRNRYGGFDLGMQLPPDLQMDIRAVPKNRTLSKVWFNPEGHHTMPAYLNSLNNLILRSNLPADKDPRKYAISVSSHPYFGRADDEDAIVQGMLHILVAMCVLTGYSITTASFAIYEVNEHHSGSKRLQHIAGIGEPFYWAVNFFYDMVIYMIPVALTVGVIAAFQIPAFTERQNLGAITLLLVLFGFASFPWMYLLSGVFKDAEMAFITYVCINLFISVNTIMSTSILYFLSQISMHNPEAIQAVFEKLSYAFLIFPQFNFGNGLMQLARMNIEVQILSGYGVDAYQNPFSTETLGWMFISSFIQGLVFFTLRLLLNKSLMRKVRRLISGRKSVPHVTYENEDEDVAAEHQRVSSGAASSDILQVNQLTKVYHHLKRKVHAVKRVSVGIPAGECFGLLGVNGAGKTTTFKMLTGDVSPTDGTAQIRDWDGRLVDIMECRNQGINIGYCPQVDALDDLLTGEEHLYFYARIRGISKRQIEGVVNYLLKRLELNYHRNIITDSYSCGTRRKLSTALALIGHPQILLLDEPSSGMDPRTKRHLMEECEALCSRLAIMVKGQFRCLGSLQHIKNRFGSGFTVKMYLAEASSDAEAITGFMQRRFPSTYLKDQHSTMVEYHVPVAPGGVADIFDQLESNKNALQIKHFSVSQTTLDEVFINFAMGKIGMENIPIDNEDEFDDLDSIKAVQT
ncbi:hypothetical protein INR49_005262 [Caranx melampygus]|nr:hypothetical protein INR49_005262 [Caranx melampygus]